MRLGVRPEVRLEVKVDPGEPRPPGVRAGLRLEEKLELRLWVMPEIIILVCSVVRVWPWL